MNGERLTCEVALSLHRRAPERVREGMKRRRRTWHGGSKLKSEVLRYPNGRAGGVVLATRHWR
jgi:hypothetical protein